MSRRCGPEKSVMYTAMWWPSYGRVASTVSRNTSSWCAPICIRAAYRLRRCRSRVAGAPMIFS